MTNLRKIMAVILAITMIMSLAVSVSAAGGQQTYTLTVTGAYDGETYYAYKIFDSTYDSTNNAYSYTIDSGSDFFSAISGASDGQGDSLYGYLTLTQVGSTTTYVVEYDETAGNNGGSESDFLEKFKAVIETVIDSVSPTATTPASYGTAVFTNLASGYYYVTTTVGSMVSIGNTPVSDGDGTVQEKNTEPTVTKEVYQGEDDPTNGGTGNWGETSNAQIGDTVYFKTTINSIDDVNNITLYDSMEAGLDYEGIASVVFYYENGVTPVTLVDSTGTVNAGDSTYSITVDSDASSVYYKVSITDTEYGDGTGYYTESSGVYSPASGAYSSSATYYIRGDFSMTFDLDDSVTVGVNSYIVVTYTATVNDEAEIYEDSNDNSTYVKFGTSSYSEPGGTKTYVYELEIFKYTESDTPLEGVKFTLSYEDGETTYYLVSDDSKSPYTITGATDVAGNATEFVTNSDGKIVISGLDSDKTYSLTETEALAGYNKLTGSVTVNIIGVDETSTNPQLDAGNVNFTYDGSTTSNAEKVSVQNNTGSELPDTGGIGTTIFYVVGGILVVGAVVLLITKKRLGNKED